MSRYRPLWEYVSLHDCDELTLSFSEIAGTFGLSIDHTFLRFGKELHAYGFRVGRVSVQDQEITFLRLAFGERVSLPE